MLGVAHRQPYRLQEPLVRLVHLDVGQERKIIHRDPIGFRCAVRYPARVRFPPSVGAKAAVFFSWVNSMMPSAVEMGVFCRAKPRSSHTRRSICGWPPCSLPTSG